MNDQNHSNNGLDESLHHLVNSDGQNANEMQILNEALKNLISEAYEGIIILDRNGYCQYTNKKHAKYLKIPQESALNRHITDITDKKTADVFLDVLRTGRPDLRGIVQAHGKEYVANRVPIKKGNDIIGAAGVILFDIKEANLLNKKMIRLENQLKFFIDQVKTLRSSKYSFDDIIGESNILKGTMKEAQRAATLDANVLISGGSGTGKELFAHAIHNQSLRKSGPFIKVNCSAVPKDLLEAELFGYAPGSFTGALKEGKKGKFELANKGSIFLDEIGDMPVEMQSSLLRVLQEKEVDRIGSTRSVKVDFRVIAATNRNLEERIKQGTFRPDLYYRLNVVRIELPALNKRKEDIPLLAQSFLKRKSEEVGGIDISVSSGALDLLQSFDYPGNVRELENIIEKVLSKMDIDILFEKKLNITRNHVAAVIHSEKFEEIKTILPPQKIIKPGDEDTKHSKYEGITNLKQIKRDQEIKALKKAIKLTDGNLTESAKMLGIHRTIIHRKIKAFNLNSDVLIARKKKIEKMIEE